ncbi:hypothetical protein OCS_03646 [Ophiocordyceps sinensis CO18]|uniref:Integral membrane protein n=1 Tax=Ophiocordyceps sinensis (strain Co18 / CGMCC 3.14243) TaxID=911162 RepID=T5AFQ9_OPHSC|nr:hypothetical protein OCS_03646 [Ophiocordyceps sinensis CO18]
MAQAQAPITTIPPFNDAGKLPDCAKRCGPLYDANGACVPPAAPEAAAGSYTPPPPPKPLPAPTRPAFAATPRSPLSPKESRAAQGGGAGDNEKPSNGQTGSKGNQKQSSNTPGPSTGNGGDWLSNHWQWVIMIVVLVVGIAAIWIGACVWRRRYLRKKDSQMSLPQKHSGSAANPSWGPAIVGSESTTPMTCARDPEQSLPEKPKKKEKKAWTVGRRT